MAADPCTALTTEIELTREKFHRWVVVIPERKLPLPSNDPDWTNLALAKEYEYNFKLALDMLEHFTGGDLGKTVRIHHPDSLLASHVTIADLFHYVMNYFNLYREDINLET